MTTREADTELTEVTGFYERSRGYGLGWFADAYLFSDAFLQQASYNYLTGDFEAVVRDLADEVDDPRASHLLASAKFQMARQRYRASRTTTRKSSRRSWRSFRRCSRT